VEAKQLVELKSTNSSFDLHSHLLFLYLSNLLSLLTQYIFSAGHSEGETPGIHSEPGS